MSGRKDDPRPLRRGALGAVLLASLTTLVTLAAPERAEAHPVGFGVLSFEEVPDTEGGRWDVLLRVSGPREEALSVTPVLPEGCEELAPMTVSIASRGVDRRYALRCPSPLTGTVGVRGLRPDFSISMRLSRLSASGGGTEGGTEVVMLDGSRPTLVLEDGARLGGSIFAAYAAIGVEHILSGIDHLLFVLGLLVLLRTRKRALLVTITSFTVGHSLTLALATFGAVHVSSAAAEAVIALSILLLAVELTQPADPPTLTRRYPGFVAGAFGLVHGLGFAGALADVGLPQDEVPLALFAFNVGVEVGQLLFVAAALGAFLLIGRRLSAPLAARAETLTVYAMGTAAAFFVIERLALIVTA